MLQSPWQGVEDEASPETDAIADLARIDGAIVPAIWQLELANVLLQAERRGRITADDSAARLTLLAILPITIDQDTSGRAWREVPGLAGKHKLTSNDAAYPELALRTGIPLASKDMRLRAAAVAEGVKTLP